MSSARSLGSKCLPRPRYKHLYYLKRYLRFVLDGSRQASRVIVGLCPIAVESRDEERYLDPLNASHAKGLSVNCALFSELREEVLDEMRKNVHGLLRLDLASELDINALTVAKSSIVVSRNRSGNEQHIEKGRSLVRNSRGQNGDSIKWYR